MPLLQNLSAAMSSNQLPKNKKKVDVVVMYS